MQTDSQQFSQTKLQGFSQTDLQRFSQTDLQYFMHCLSPEGCIIAPSPPPAVSLTLALLMPCTYNVLVTVQGKVAGRCAGVCALWMSLARAL